MIRDLDVTLKRILTYLVSRGWIISNPNTTPLILNKIDAPIYIKISETEVNIITPTLELERTINIDGIDVKEYINQIQQAIATSKHEIESDKNDKDVDIEIARFILCEILVARKDYLKGNEIKFLKPYISDSLYYLLIMSCSGDIEKYVPEISKLDYCPETNKFKVVLLNNEANIQRLQLLLNTGSVNI